MKKNYKKRAGKRGRGPYSFNSNYYWWCRMTRGVITYKTYEKIRGWNE